MRTIQKQISLESLTSRLPSVWPSYWNNELYFFDEKSLSGRSYDHTSNWGMIPLNIVLNHKPSEGVKWNEYQLTANTCHCYFEGEVNYDEFCDFTLSFDSLGKWYHFFNEYYNLLKKYGHCNRVYTSAEDYYNYESSTKYASQMIYGTDKQTYLDLDKEFAKKGGIVEVLVFNKETSEYLKMTPRDAHDETREDKMSMIDVYDVGFFKWIGENVVPSFSLPRMYKDYWKRDVLFYPDVIKWMAWFRERINYETDASYIPPSSGETELWDCKQSEVSNCCDCEEYFNRGGKRVFSAMCEWFNSVQEKVSGNTKIISEKTSCFIPTIILPTELQVSTDDLGEFSILAKEYELGIDYRGTNDLTETTNTRVGTVATINGRSIILNEGSGYMFEPIYMEKYVASCSTCGYEGVFYDRCPKCGGESVELVGWDDYSKKYINENREDFYVSAITYFAYDENDVKYISSANSKSEAEIDFKEQMAKKYPLALKEKGWVLIGDKLYEINKAEYATYDKSNKYLGNKKYMIFRENGTNTPYTFINGKQIYAEFYEPKNKFYFPFFKRDDSSPNDLTCVGKTFNFDEYIQFDRNQLNNEMLYVYYNDNAYEIDEDKSTVTIDGTEFLRISGYTIDDENAMIYLSHDGELVSGETLNTIDDDVAKVELIDEKPFVIVNYPFEIQMYVADEINGRTVSKLSDLRLYDVLCDDIGNNIDGIYEIKSENIHNHQPPEGKELEPLYQVGNTANISRFSLTEDDLDNIVGDKNYFVGDIITRMTFYYKETDETIPEETVVDVRLITSADTYVITMEHKNKTTILTGSGITYTSLSAISASTIAKEELEKDEEVVYIFYDDVFCDITYYVGATLRRKEGENYNLCYEKGKNNHGVEYQETIQFVKENREYYLKKQPKDAVIPSRKNDVSAHSISYPIYVYKLQQLLEHVDNSQYDSSYSVPMSNFKMNISLFSGNTNTFDEQNDMEHYNGMQVLPVFREEYRLGISSLENVKSDIYIDRGINAAFEKHLKLGEVTSLETLENYGSNFFKMMEN